MLKLFLLKPDFTDDANGITGKRYYCPGCAMVKGMLGYYPQISENIEIQYVDFQRPRHDIIELIGQENQSCPVLILDENDLGLKPVYCQQFGEKYFINSPDLIVSYLAERFGTGIPH